MTTKAQTQTLINQTTTIANPNSVDVSTADHIIVTATIEQVGTATTAAVLTVEGSPDNGTTWVEIARVSAGVNAGTYEFVIPISTAWPSIRTPFTAQSGGTSSTANCWVLTATL